MKPLGGRSARSTSMPVGDPAGTYSSTLARARLLASGLSIAIAFASWRLMHDQRGHAINHGQVAKRIAEHLDLARVLGGRIGPDHDAKPESNGRRAHLGCRRQRPHLRAWGFLILAFAVADLIIIISVLFSLSWVNTLH